MPTFQQVQTATEILAKAAMDSVGAAISYGNVSNTTLHAGTTPWCQVTVIEYTDSQTTLGLPDSSRTRGSATFVLFVRKNQGSAKHTQMREAIKDRFKSKIVGGATFQNTRSTILGETENWSLTGVEVPFYFDA